MSQPAPSPQNPLGVLPIPKLLLRYAVPSVVSMLVMSVYNIVDQIFIGWGVGYLGNGATTVAFPLVTVMLSISLLVGNGAAAFISLELGRGNSDNAKRTTGNAIAMLVVCSLALMALILPNMERILTLLAATPEIMPYAMEYTSVIILGAPFAMLSVGLSNIIRADGSPRISMAANLTGALLNIALDPIFIFGLDMGVRGAALATILSQMVSTVFTLVYVLRFSNYIRVRPKHLRPKGLVLRKITALGSSSFANQFAIALVNVVLNNSIAYYGALSPYGSEIPLAAIGIVMKINTILIGIIVGVTIGNQPILGFNYGAQNYERVRKSFRTGVTITFGVAAVFCLLFIFTPGIFISIFGDSNQQFNEFAASVLRIFLCCVFTAGIQIPGANYFQAVGRPVKAMMLTMTRQLFLLVPMVLVLPLFFGLDGILYAGPVADVLSCVITSFFVVKEMRRLTLLSPGLAGEQSPVAGG